jgi:hypothetical protein
LSALTRRERPRQAAPVQIAAWTPQQFKRTSHLERQQTSRDPRRATRDLIDARLVDYGLVEFVVEGLGAELWPLSYDDLYDDWHPGDATVAS